ASTVLLLREFDIYGHEAEADSLLKLIDHKARPDYLVAGITAILENQLKYSKEQTVESMNLLTEGDSVMGYNPARSRVSLLTFTRTHENRTDSLTSTLRSLAKKYKKRQLQIVDISLQKDTIEWHKAIRNDSARWVHAWVPGGLANQALSQLRLPRLPYYVVTDSTGRQLYRGESIKQAAAVASTTADMK
ncbi:MAG: thioredoxin family protein, partial [Muribaculaceae bacterium]|nr:thioredoxin family protein [Muribaculaceae bacterium]